MIRIHIEDVDYYCQHCDSAMIGTDCRSPYCSGYRCLLCEHGCDIDDEISLCRTDPPPNPAQEWA